MHHFAAAELDLQLDLHALPHEFLGVAHLHLVVVLGDVHVEREFLELGRGGVLLGVLLALVEVVDVLAVIDDLADGRIGGGVDLDEIKLPLARGGHGLGEAHYAKRFAVAINDEDFAGANFIIAADEGLVERDNASGWGVGSAVELEDYNERFAISSSSW